MQVIGVTGGVGCGKSEVLKHLQTLCTCDVIRTDDVANAVKEPGGICYNEIVALLGEDVLEERSLDCARDDNARPIDRGKMAEKIFSDDTLLKQVNAILHPAVRNYVLEQIKTARKENALDVLFVEAALLIESGYVSKRSLDCARDDRRTLDSTPRGCVEDNKETVILDEMWYVYAPEDVRRERLKKYRGYSDEKINSIMAKQLTEEQFRAGCDFEINNGGAIETAVAQAGERISSLGAPRDDKTTRVDRE